MLTPWRKQIWRRYPGKKMKLASRYKKWLEGGGEAGFGRVYLQGGGVPLSDCYYYVYWNLWRPSHVAETVNR